MEEDRSKTIEVFKGSPWEAELIKGLLADNGITAITQDGVMGSIAPNLMPDVRVLVNEGDYESAMAVVRNREKEKNAD